MNTSALYPPNSQQLSEEVIGDVVQCARRIFNHTDESRRFFAPPPLHASQLVQAQSLGAPKSPAVIHQPTVKSTKLTGSHRRHTALAETSEHEANAQAAAELRRRRERNRLNQARYKMKQNLRATNLEKSIQVLQKEIEELRIRRQIVNSVAPATKAIWSVAVEYFRLFRFGVQASGSQNGQTGAQPMHDLEVQRSFLEATTTPNMTDGTVYGVELFMQNWIKISTYFPDMDIELERLDNGPGNELLAVVKQNVTITQDMLLHVFPHLFSNEGFHLVSKLLGQQFVLHGLVVFKWDHSSNRVCGISYKTDLLTPLLRLVGSLEDVSRVFENARLTPDCGFSP